jgi:hypothetical protein
MVKGSFMLAFLLVLSMIYVEHGLSIERYAPDGRDRWTQPLAVDQMAQYADIAFTEKNFEKVQLGMYEEDVLKLLGKPQDVKMIKRRKNRWTIWYYYPGGREVAIRNGVVQGLQ